MGSVFDRRNGSKTTTVCIYTRIYVYTRVVMVVVGERCVGEKLLYEGGRSDRWVLHPVSCRRIIRADKSQRNTLYRWGWGMPVRREEERGEGRGEGAGFGVVLGKVES